MKVVLITVLMLASALALPQQRNQQKQDFSPEISAEFRQYICSSEALKDFLENIKPFFPPPTTAQPRVRDLGRSARGPTGQSDDLKIGKVIHGLVHFTKEVCTENPVRDANVIAERLVRVLEGKGPSGHGPSGPEELTPEAENALKQFLCENVAMGNFLKGLTEKLKAIFGEQDGGSDEKRELQQRAIKVEHVIHDLLEMHEEVCDPPSSETDTRDVAARGSSEEFTPPELTAEQKGKLEAVLCKPELGELMEEVKSVMKEVFGEPEGDRTTRGKGPSGPPKPPKPFRVIKKLREQLCRPLTTAAPEKRNLESLISLLEKLQ